MQPSCRHFVHCLCSPISVKDATTPLPRPKTLALPMTSCVFSDVISNPIYPTIKICSELANLRPPSLPPLLPFIPTSPTIPTTTFGLSHHHISTWDTVDPNPGSLRGQDLDGARMPVLEAEFHCLWALWRYTTYIVSSSFRFLWQIIKMWQVLRIW